MLREFLDANACDTLALHLCNKKSPGTKVYVLPYSWDVSELRE